MSGRKSTVGKSGVKFVTAPDQLTGDESRDAAALFEDKTSIIADQAGLKGDVKLTSIHNQIQSDLNKDLKLTQAKLQPNYVLLKRGEKLKKESKKLLEDVARYKETLSKTVFSNADIDILVSKMFQTLKEEMMMKIDVEYPIN